MLFKKSNSDRKKLQKLIGFLNAKRFWLCAGNCIVAPECFYCQLTYQLNYSYKKTEKLVCFYLKIVYFQMHLIVSKSYMRDIKKKENGRIIVNLLIK